MSELLSCPFCGGEASVKVLEYDDDCKVWGVFCELDLESEYSHGHFVDNYPTEAEAIAAWNTRHVETCENMREKFGYKRLFVCSECGVSFDPDCEINYCPSCGCKVVGE